MASVAKMAFQVPKSEFLIEMNGGFHFRDGFQVHFPVIILSSRLNDDIQQLAAPALASDRRFKVKFLQFANLLGCKGPFKLAVSATANHLLFFRFPQYPILGSLLLIKIIKRL